MMIAQQACSSLQDRCGCAIGHEDGERGRRALKALNRLARTPANSSPVFRWPMVGPSGPKTSLVSLRPDDSGTTVRTGAPGIGCPAIQGSSRSGKYRSELREGSLMAAPGFYRIEHLSGMPMGRAPPSNSNPAPRCACPCCSITHLKPPANWCRVLVVRPNFTRPAAIDQRPMCNGCPSGSNRRPICCSSGFGARCPRAHNSRDRPRPRSRRKATERRIGCG